MGINSLKEKFLNSKIVCSRSCEINIKKECQSYFLLYLDNPYYHYEMKPVDIAIIESESIIAWKGFDLKFILTPGHSMGSMCTNVENILFTGDTILPNPLRFNKRCGNINLLKKSINQINSNYPSDTIIYPGHGEKLFLKDRNKNDEWMI